MLEYMIIDGLQYNVVVDVSAQQLRGVVMCYATHGQYDCRQPMVLHK